MAILTYVVWLAVNIVVVKGCSEGCAPKPSGPGEFVFVYILLTISDIIFL